MAKYYLFIKPISRATGAQATRYAAYRAGEKITDQRTGRVYNFSDRDDVIHKEIVLPSHVAESADLSWALDRSTLWNAAEHADARCDSRVAREVLVVLPSELSPAQRTNLALTFARNLADKYQNAVDVAIHPPRPTADEPDNHAHLLMTTREVTAHGLGSRTTLELGGNERKARGLGPNRNEYFWIRERWGKVTNEALREAGHQARVDQRGYRDQGIDWEPALKLPAKVYYTERTTGKRTEVGDAIRARHRELIEARLKGGDEFARVLKKQKEEARQAAIERSKQKASVAKRIPRGALTRQELNGLRREWRRANRDRVNQRTREWYKKYTAAESQQQRAERQKRAREWHQANKERVNERNRELYKQNAATRREQLRVYRQKNADRVKEQSARWRAANAEKLNRRARERWARARAPPQASLAAAQDPTLVKQSGKLVAENVASGTAKESAWKWRELREGQVQGPTAEESARKWRELRESEGLGPIAGESARKWQELRERQGPEPTAEDRQVQPSDSQTPSEVPPRERQPGGIDDDQPARTDRSHDHDYGLE